MSKLTMSVPRDKAGDDGVQGDFERTLDTVLTQLRAGAIRLRLLDVHYEIMEVEAR